MTRLERFGKIFTVLPSGCWQHKHVRRDGYAMFAGDYAHRYAYLVFIGEIPADLELDHLCRNRGCVNPEHLQAVTHAENKARQTSKTCSKCGRDKGLDGKCRPCYNAYMRAYQAKRRS